MVQDRVEVLFGAPPHRGPLDAPRAGPHQYIGAVHDVDHCGGIVTVLVPHPTTGQLGWTSIWCVKADVDGCGRICGTGTGFAPLVENNVLASWFRHGFENHFQVWLERNGVATLAQILNMGQRHQLNVRPEIVRGEDS